MNICFDNFAFCTELYCRYKIWFLYEVCAFGLVQNICMAHTNLHLTFIFISTKVNLIPPFIRKIWDNQCRSHFCNHSLCPSPTCINKVLGLFISEQLWGMFSNYSSTAISAGFVLIENAPWSGGQIPSEWKFGSDILSEQLDASIYTINLGKGQQKRRNWGVEKLLTIPTHRQKGEEQRISNFL